MRAAYAWVTLMPDGNWSFVGVLTAVGHAPAISHKREVIEGLRHFAVAHGEATGQPVELVMFQAMKTLERIEP